MTGRVRLEIRTFRHLDLVHAIVNTLRILYKPNNGKGQLDIAITDSALMSGLWRDVQMCTEVSLHNQRCLSIGSSFCRKVANKLERERKVAMPAPACHQPVTALFFGSSLHDYQGCPQLRLSTSSFICTFAMYLRSPACMSRYVEDVSTTKLCKYESPVLRYLSTSHVALQ